MRRSSALGASLASCFPENSARSYLARLLADLTLDKSFYLRRSGLELLLRNLGKQ